jgi:hypothetical protein
VGTQDKKARSKTWTKSLGIFEACYLPAGSNSLILPQAATSTPSSLPGRRSGSTQGTRAPPPCLFATRVHMTARLEVGRALDPACSSVTAPPVAPEAEDRTKFVAEPAEAHKWSAKEFVEFKALAESSDALARRLAVC